MGRWLFWMPLVWVLAACSGECHDREGSYVRCGGFGRDSIASDRWTRYPEESDSFEAGPNYLAVRSAPDWRIASQTLSIPRGPAGADVTPRYYRLDFTGRTNGHTELRVQVFDYDRSETLFLFHESSTETVTRSVRFRVDPSDGTNLAVRFGPSTFDEGQGRIWMYGVDVVADDAADGANFFAHRSLPAQSASGSLLLFEALFGATDGTVRPWLFSLDGIQRFAASVSTGSVDGWTSGSGSYQLSSTKPVATGTLAPLAGPPVTVLGPPDATLQLLVDPMLRVAEKQKLFPSAPWNFVVPTGVDFESVFDPEKALTRDETTADAIDTALHARLASVLPTLQAAWPTLSSDRLTALFLVNVVARLWHYGNYVRKGDVGCVGEHELVTAAEADDEIDYDDRAPIYIRTPTSLRDYLQSPIGCCSDHAFFLKFLFERFGMEARRSYIPGHVTVEAKIDGQWNVVDATTRVIVTRSMSEMLTGVARDVYLFPADYYRTQCTACTQTQLGPNWAAFIGAVGTPFASRGDYFYTTDYDDFEQAMLSR